VQISEVTHREQEVRRRHVPRQLVLDGQRAEAALGDHHEQQQQRELAELRTPAEQQHRQHDLQHPDDHRGESVAVLVQNAADHLWEQLPVTHERWFRARETRARGIHGAADDQQHEGRERSDLGEPVLEHRA
jgi:hypothetical protein